MLDSVRAPLCDSEMEKKKRVGKNMLSYDQKETRSSFAEVVLKGS